MVHFDAMKRAALFGLEGESKRGRGCFIVHDEARGIMIHKIRVFLQFYYPRKGIIWLSQQKTKNICVAYIYNLYFRAAWDSMEAKFNVTE
jgi:hypothetical protein